MKVLVTLNSLALGGCQLNAIDLAAAAARHDVRSVVVGYSSTLPTSGASILDAAEDRGVEVQVLDLPIATAPAAPALARIADAHDVDLVHAYGGWDLRPAFLGPCRWGRRPLVQTVYEMYVSSLTYSHQPLIVGTGYQYDEQRCTHHGPVDLVSPPVDLATDTPAHDPTAFREAFGLDPSRCHVVIVSRLDAAMKELGIRQTIEAMELLDRDQVDLVIVGSGDAESRLRSAGERVNDRVGRPAVRFCGPLHDPRGAYAAADIVLGMGGSAARGLAFAKPVIVCGEHGWYRTFTPHTSTQLFRSSFWSDESDPAPVEGLAAQLQRLVDDEPARRCLGAYGRDFAEHHFGLDLMARRQVEAYQRALTHHRRASWYRDLAQEVRPGLSWVRRTWQSPGHMDETATPGHMNETAASWVPLGSRTDDDS